MKTTLLCFSDLHRDLAAARRLAGLALGGRYAFLISAGDLGVDGVHEPGLTSLIAKGGTEILSVPGNHDGTASYQAEAHGGGWTDLDGRTVKRGEWWFAGIGLLPAPYTTSSPARDFETRTALLLESFAHLPLSRLVLVTHVPPSETIAARDRRFIDRGSVVLANWLQSHPVAAVVCGHVHHPEPVVTEIGSTRIIVGGPWASELTLGND
ncbi:MAG: metallophosphoesterase [Anaeromyxobacteraceae bacterium]